MFKESEVFKRALWTLLGIVIYLVGTKITILYVDPSLISQNSVYISNRLLKSLTFYSAGRFDNASIFALGVSPYITASIFTSVLFNTVPYFIEKKKMEDRGLINRFTKNLSLPLSAVQAIILLRAILQAHRNNSTVITTSIDTIGRLIWFSTATVLALVAGSMFLVWLGEFITEHGLGSGTSIIITTSILRSTVNDLSLLSKSGHIKLWLVITAIIAIIIVFLEQAKRNLTLLYPRSYKSGTMRQAFKTSLPLKFNQSSVLPAIFTSHVLMSMQVLGEKLYSLTPVQTISFYTPKSLTITLQQLGPLFTFGLVILMCFVYTDIFFNPKEVSEHIQRPIGAIATIRPGMSTEEYLRYISRRLTLFGGIYIGLIYVSPKLLAETLHILVPGSLSGTSLFITIVTVIELLEKVSAKLVTAHYTSRHLTGKKIL